MQHLRPGQWLGIDIGSSRRKLCSFCRITSDGQGDVTVTFEQGPAEAPYPKVNTQDALLDPSRRPTYLQAPIEAAVGRVLDDAALVRKWFEALPELPSRIAIDAPVAFALSDTSRLTERASTQTFRTPTREEFERLLQTKGDPYLRVNCFWKCVGLAVYHCLGRRLAGSSGDLADSTDDLAAWTCPDTDTSWRLRETFPSDVYKRANGTAGKLHLAPRRVLEALVQHGPWRGDGTPGRHPHFSTLRRLETLRAQLRSELETSDRLREMQKYGGTFGDLWDAFACAFTACCEDHDGAIFHGLETFQNAEDSDIDSLRQEGAIMTVRIA